MAILIKSLIEAFWVFTFQSVTKETMPKGGIILIKITPTNLYIICSPEVVANFAKIYTGHVLKINGFTTYSFYVENLDQIRTIAGAAGFNITFLNSNTPN